MVHLDDFQFTSQAEETDQLVADTAKHIGHFFDKEDKNPWLLIIPNQPHIR